MTAQAATAETAKVILPTTSVYVSRRLKLDELKEGQRFEVTRKVRLWHILLTAITYGDFNWIHWNPFFARKQQFKTIVAHGIVTAGFLSAAAARIFRRGCRVSEIDAKFRQPLYPGDRVQCVLTIEKINRRGRVNVSFEANTSNPKESICSGTFNVWIPTSN